MTTQPNVIRKPATSKKKPNCCTIFDMGYTKQRATILGGALDTYTYKYILCVEPSFDIIWAVPCIGKPQEHQLMADKLNFAVLNGQSMRRSTGGFVAKLNFHSENYVEIKFKN